MIGIKLSDHNSSWTRNVIGLVLTGLLFLALTGATGLLWVHRARVMQTADAAHPLSSPQANVVPWGVNAALDQYDDEELARALDQIAAAGFHWVRQTFPWAEIEPRPGEFDWRTADRIIAACAARNLALIAVLDTTPAWARPAGTSNAHTPPRKVADFGGFARAFAARYGDRVDYYQIWDEPNLSAHWGGAYVDPAAYARLLREGAVQIRSADPSAVILTAGLAPTTERGPLNLDEADYLRGLLAARADDFFDVVAIKPYGFSQLADAPPDGEALDFGRAAWVRQALVDAGRADLPIWAVEFGWNALPTDWAGQPSIWGQVSEEEQAAYTVAAVERAQRDWPWMGALCVSTFQPNAPATDPRWGFALVGADGTPRAVYHTLQAQASAPIVAGPGVYPATHPSGEYRGDWRFSVAGADIPWGAGRDTQSLDEASLRIHFSGTALDLTVRRGDYWGLLYVTVDGAPANALPVDPDRPVASYLVLHDPLHATASVPVARNLPAGPHLAEVTPVGGWGQWALVGWTVRREPDLRGTNLALAALGLCAALTLAGVIWQAASGPTRWANTRALLRAVSTLAQTWTRRYRALPEWVQATLTLGAAVAFAFAPGLPASLGTLAVLGILVVLRLDLGLAMVALVAPFFLYPKALLGKHFSLVEIITLLCVLAWPLHWWLRRENPDLKLRAERTKPAKGGLLTCSSGRLGRFQRPLAAQPGASSSKQGFTTLDWGVVALVALSALSLTWAPNFGVASREFRVVILESALFYGLLRVARLDVAQRWRVVDAWLLGALAVSLVGLAQFAITGNVIAAEGVRRVRGVYGSPNNLALFLERAVPMLAAGILWPAGRWRCRLYALALLPVLVCLVLTFSRGALLLAVPVAALFLGALRGRRALVVSVALLAVAALVLLPMARTERFASLLNTRSGTTFFRFQLWRATLNLIGDHPLTGVGLDNFLYQYRTRYVLPAAWQELDLSHPHNLVLDFWVRLGVLGVVVLAWLEVAFFRQGLAFYRRTTSPRMKALAAGLMASMVAALAHGLIDQGFFLVDLAFVFMLTLGLLSPLGARKDTLHLPSSPIKDSADLLQCPRSNRN
ncbi:MAG: O-antigen ligase family protein [Anaerolineae bacterium]|nr:O-antigen ligase family protein [Anaerolineae bacterium]